MIVQRILYSINLITSNYHLPVSLLSVILLHVALTISGQVHCKTNIIDTMLLSVQFSSVYLMPFKQLHDKIQFII